MARFKKGSIQAKRYMASIRKRKRKSTVTTRRKTKRRVSNMARRRRTRTVYRSRPKHSFRRTARSFGKNEMLGIGIAGATEGVVNQLVSSFAPQFAFADDFIKIGIGYFLQKKKGLVGGIGKGFLALGIARVAQQVAGPMISGFAGGSGSTSGPNVV